MLLARVQPPPHRLGFACDHQSCHAVDSPQTTRSGLFWSGQIDLTGDGLLEQIRRVGGQVIIYKDGLEVWRSEPEWNVVDLALGDPNDDGRGEALLAFWKPDKTGQRRSQPFIIGYRRGIYRDLWGGSPVTDPIYEVELGDVDADGIQELIVLEQVGLVADNRAVSVWRWHGWGFSLIWRSDPAPYRDLVLLPGQPPIISVTVP